MPGAAVDRVELRAAAQERLVPVAARDHDRPEEVEAGARLAAAVEVVVAAEQVHLELEGAGREASVDVAVRAGGEAVLAGGDVVGPLGPVDDDAVGRVAERRRRSRSRGRSARPSRRGRRRRRAGRGSASRREPASPAIEIESVLVVVAAPHAAGSAPNRSWPPETTSVACEPVAIVAVTVFVAAS